MKLCRFELKSDPGVPRTGIVRAGKILETQEGEGVGIHDAIDVRPLAPIARAPSIRVFRSDLQPREEEQGEEPRFFYLNPASLVGSSQLVNLPEFSNEFGFDPYVAAIVAGPGYLISVEEADDFTVGYTILNLLVARDVERGEMRSGSGFGRSHDVAGTIGPVITTPEELDDAIDDAEHGKQFALSVTARLNSSDRGEGSLADLPITFAQAISAASQSCTLLDGDIIALGPLVRQTSTTPIEAGDEIQIAVERLGMLATKISPISHE